MKLTLPLFALLTFAMVGASDLDGIRDRLQRLEGSLIRALTAHGSLGCANEDTMPMRTALYNLWQALPKPQTLSGLQKEFEDGDTPNGRYPILINHIRDGGKKYGDTTNPQPQSNSTYFYYTTRLIGIMCRGAEQDSRSILLATATALEIMSNRMRLGAYVANAKFEADKKTYCSLIKNRDVVGIRKALTDVKQEKVVLDRVSNKTRTIALAGDYVDETAAKLQAEYVQELYRDYLIPITTDVEVATMLHFADKCK